MIVEGYDVRLSSKSERKTSLSLTYGIKKNVKKSVYLGAVVNLEKKDSAVSSNPTNNLMNGFNNYNQDGKDVTTPEAVYQNMRREFMRIINESITKLLAKLFGENSPEYKDAMDSLGIENNNYAQEMIVREETTIKLQKTEKFSEQQSVEFKAQGKIVTSDGRQIPLELSFAHYESVQMQTVSTVKVENNVTIKKVIDPLVINIDSKLTGLSDVKINFDLDTDGKKEKIHVPKLGSGFLALDKNNDGKINDGNELFGTKSGDGFKDLAQYDDDKNGWIDENDAVFKNLKVWAVSDKGQMKLIDLKTANVGAIYLGNASTHMMLKNNGQESGILRKTGIFLKEDGNCGTINHVDLIA